MRDLSRGKRTGRSAGFSLTELVVVVGIMMLLAAMGFPAIARYFRNFKIRGAQQQVAGAVQLARNRAISKNVNNGVAFVIEDVTHYWVHVMDDQSAAHTSSAVPLAFAAPDAGQSVRYTLPEGTVFASSAAECPSTTLAAVGQTGTFGPLNGWFRFSRLGAWCGSSCVPALATTPSSATLMMNGGTGTILCLYQPSTRLSRAIVVSPGGRVRTQQ